ncbi:diacylglycerol/lipid kinase family protein [Streptomyces sp. NPDC050560]|uniref:diacylglycerol/lipid kinase family protein n=1 Tax=Streptomyces sp. NPDC050560 TaxID=3365630 RepID=UPI0037A8BC2E
MHRNREGKREEEPGPRAAAPWPPDGRTVRRAALRGTGSLVLAFGAARALVRGAARPGRPPGAAADTAAAAALTAGAMLEAPRYGLLVAPVAGAVAGYRVRAGERHRGDLVAGALIGVGTALLTCRWWPLRPKAAAAAAPPRRPAPALPEGAGLRLVVNPSSGPTRDGEGAAAELRRLLPRARVTVLAPDDDPSRVLEDAARDAAGDAGALGVFGGDGTVNAATGAAVRHGVPLAVFPGGTFNHFASDLGNATPADVAQAVCRGEAVVSDAGRAEPREGPGQLFLNTFSLGVYSDLVHVRERLEPRIGKWPALAVGLARVLATGSPVTVAVNGTPKRLWLLFAGNGVYHPAGFAPAYRTRLDDGLLDVRAVDGGSAFARTRLLLAVLTGTLHGSRVLTTAQVRRLRIEVLEGDPRFSYDGEVAEAGDRHLMLDKLPRAVTVYRPADPDGWLY